MGWFDGNSTRTPTTLISCTFAVTALLVAERLSVTLPRCAQDTRATGTRFPGRSNQERLAAEQRPQACLDKSRVQAHRQRRDLPRRLFRASARLWVALAHERGDDLFDETELAVGRGLESA